MKIIARFYSAILFCFLAGCEQFPELEKDKRTLTKILSGDPCKSLERLARSPFEVTFTIGERENERVVNSFDNPTRAIVFFSEKGSEGVVATYRLIVLFDDNKCQVSFKFDQQNKAVFGKY